MNDSILADIFSFLEMTVMERLDDGFLRLIGAVPDWFKRLFPKAALCKKQISPGLESSFLENFLIDAEDFWATETTGRVKSGPWIETDPSGDDYALEATAVLMGKRKILLIELGRYSHDEIQFLFQQWRELSLDYHGLKRLQEALRESEEKYRTVLEANPDPVVVYDMEGNVIYFNPAFTSVFGWNLDECLGRKMDFFVPNEAWPETKAMIDKVLAGETFSGLETRRYTKEGTIIPVNISGAISRDRNGNPGGSIVNIRDISEQKKLEGQLQQAKKMEAIGLLAGGVAHDLNNVLTGTVTYPDLLLMQIPEDSPLRKPILTIQESGKKAAAIVQDLLTLARRGVVTQEVVNLNAVISECLATPEHEKLKLYHPGVEVETDRGADLLNISGSPLHLSKTVMNLVSNAAEAMPDGGKIFISTENRYIDRPISGYAGMEKGDYVILTVTDTGTGISAENLNRIFEPFYTKKVMGKSGTGLGMAVVWGTVKDLKGYIDVQSTEGKGTAFTLYFPATSQEIAKDKAQSPIADYAGKGESILVVDDIKEQRDIALNILTVLGYVADTVSSGEEAIEYLKAHNVDLIVLDMIMDPGIDGLDTYKKILEVNPRQKAIIASGFSETDRVKEAQRLGAGAYVKKPYTMEKIGLAVKNELGN
jgi:PAS domain S-box-containing protein